MNNLRRWAILLGFAEPMLFLAATVYASPPPMPTVDLPQFGPNVNFDTYPPRRPGMPGTPTMDGQIVVDQYPGVTFIQPPGYLATIVTPSSTNTKPRALRLCQNGVHRCEQPVICNHGVPGLTQPLRITFAYMPDAVRRIRTASLSTGLTGWGLSPLRARVVANRYTAGSPVTAPPKTLTSVGVNNRISVTAEAVIAGATVGDILSVDVYFQPTSCTSASVPLPAIDSLSWTSAK